MTLTPSPSLHAHFSCFVLRLGRACFAFLLAGAAVLQAAPEVTNITAAQRPGTKLVDITYDLATPAFPSATVSLEVSSDGGATWSVPVTTTSGHIGAGVTPGTGKAIVWNAGADWAGNYSTQMRFRVTADDGYTVPPAGFALIPGGAYQRGDNLDGMSDAPVQTITVSAFYLQTTETTQAQWDTVRAWGLSHGYTDLVTGTQAGYPSKGANHPVHSVSWFDVVKWCNARSEMEGLRPCYYTGPQKTTAQIYRTGSENVTNDAVCWGATGYRLPTEAEWEKAARGGLTGKRFPRGDTISHSQANYYVYSTDGSTDRSHPNFFYYDVSPTQGYHPTWSHNHDGNYPYTSPVGSFAANDYGLSDMAGNVWEWCWDWYGRYATDADPRGPSVGPFYRVIRGGGWGSDAGYARCAQRGISIPGYSGGHYYFFGFRPARGRL